MPYKDKEKRNEYLRLYKERKRRETGIPTKKEAAILRGKKQKESITPIIKETRMLAKKLREATWRKQWSSVRPEKRLLYAAKARAIKKDMEFSLTEADIVIPELCPYLGIPLVNSRPRGNERRDIASLDRIDNSKGYTKDNIEVISWLANTMKNNCSQELLVAFATEVLRRHNADNNLRYRMYNQEQGESIHKEQQACACGTKATQLELDLTELQ